MMATIAPHLLLLCMFSASFSISVCSVHAPPTSHGINVGNPVINVTPAPIINPSLGHKEGLLCERVHISGTSRLKLRSYANAYRITLAPSVVIPDKSHGKIQICFHRNSSLGLCQCEKDDWRSVHKGLWSSTMSPYEQRFLDVKFVDGVFGSVTVTLDEVSQGWRYVLLGLGFALLFLAPIVSTWVPFYYTSSMSIGVLAVVLILLYQGMKLLPTGRKSAFYLSIYTSVLGAGSFLIHYVSMFVNSILVNFGLSHELQHPVSVFVLLGIMFIGAGLGYWMVRKYIISEDGDVDVGVAQFIKWAMRFIAVTCIFLSTIDTPLAIVAVGSSLLLCYVITSIKWDDLPAPWLYEKPSIWVRRRQRSPKSGRPEFLSRPTNNGMVSPSGRVGSTKGQHDFYSSFHKTPNRKKFSKKEWVEFTQETTRQSVAELASSPEFADWVITNADRIKLLPADNPEVVDASGSHFATRSRLFNWRRRR